MRRIFIGKLLCNWIEVAAIQFIIFYMIVLVSVGSHNRKLNQNFLKAQKIFFFSTSERENFMWERVKCCRAISVIIMQIQTDNAQIKLWHLLCHKFSNCLLNWSDTKEWKIRWFKTLLSWKVKVSSALPVVNYVILRCITCVNKVRSRAVDSVDFLIIVVIHHDDLSLFSSLYYSHLICAKRLEIFSLSRERL